MVSSANSRMRRLWLNIHLWIGLALAALLVPISLSGALLVWHDEIEALIYPSRYAVTKGESLPPSQLMANAVAAVGQEYQPFVIRMPEDAGPVIVNVRPGRSERGERGERGERRQDAQAAPGAPAPRPRVVSVYLDPASGRVLDAVEFRSTFFGFLHRFHENLTIPDYSGRAIVGWVGVGMLLMLLTGIYLWWPRNGAFLLGFRWRRGPATSFNLHHMLGFWIALPLAVVSLTGVYLGFPQQGRDLLSSVAPMTPQQRGGFGAPPMRQMNLNPEKAIAAALFVGDGARVAAVFVPTQQNQTWRVQLRSDAEAGVMTVTVDDKTGEATKVTRLSGDRVAQWIRWIHEGSHSGVIWQIIVFLCGIFPTVFAITGVMIWLRSRAAGKMRIALSPIPRADPAE